MSEPKPPEHKALSSSLPLFIPFWVLSLLTGLVYEFSHWLGVTIGLLNCYAIFRSTCSIIKARKVDLEVIETSLLAASVPVFAALAVFSWNYSDLASNILTLIFFSSLTPNVLLLSRTRAELHHSSMLLGSLIVLIVSLIAIQFTYSLGFVPVVLSVVTAGYSLAILVGSIYVLREKLPISTLKWTSLLLTLLGMITCYVIQPFPGYIAATFAAACLFLILDFLQNMILVPSAEWTSATTRRALCHLYIKLASAVWLAAWAGLGPLTNMALGDQLQKSPAVHCAAAERVGNKCKESHSAALPGLALYLAVPTIALFLRWSMIRELVRKQESPLPDSLPMHIRIAGIVAVIAAMVSIACYYLVASPPAITAPVALLLTSALFLVLCDLIESIRASLVRFHTKLFYACLGLGVYVLCTGAYLSIPAANARQESPALREQEFQILSEFEDLRDVPESNDKTPQHREPPYITASLAAAILCCLLALHFLREIIREVRAQEAKRKKLEKTRAAAVPVNAAAAAPAAAAVPLAAQPEVDSDYDSGDNQ